MTRTTKGKAAEAGPVRMCAVCRRRLPKKALMRYVRASGEGGSGFVPDPRQTAPGRGIYLCGDDACREKFGRMTDKRKHR